MKNARFLPPVALAVTLGLLISGRIRFHRDRMGRVLTMEDGEKHVIFREVSCDSRKPASNESMAVLKVRFRFSRFPHTVNRVLSLLPIPIITGMPGFRRKCWTFCKESGYSQGIYQWESPVLAECYTRSSVMRLLRRRSVPGSTQHSVLPNTPVEDYLQGLCENNVSQGAREGL
jgi:hypothetical protein